MKGLRHAYLIPNDWRVWIRPTTSFLRITMSESTIDGSEATTSKARKCSTHGWSTQKTGMSGICLCRSGFLHDQNKKSSTDLGPCLCVVCAWCMQRRWWPPTTKGGQLMTNDSTPKRHQSHHLSSQTAQQLNYLLFIHSIIANIIPAAQHHSSSRSSRTTTTEGILMNMNKVAQSQSIILVSLPSVAVGFG